AQPVGPAFEEIGLAAFAYCMDCAPCCSFDGDDVHSVDGLGGEPVAAGLALNIRLRFGNRERCAHGVEIVLANEQYREPPQRRKIEALVKLAFRYGAVTEKAGRNDFLALHVIGKRKPDSKRQPATHYCVAAIKVGSAVKQMHRAATPAATAFPLSVHFGEHHGHRHTTHKGLAVLPIGRDDPVALLQHGNDTHRNRFLSVVKVKEAADLLLGVKFGALVFELTDADHLL